MDPARFTRVDPMTWRIEPHGAMRVPAIIYADENLIRDMDNKVFEQAVNVATLPGIVQASYAMPDAHWGYGFRGRAQQPEKLPLIGVLYADQSEPILRMARPAFRSGVRRSG